jgi:hypothetical protein
MEKEEMLLVEQYFLAAAAVPVEEHLLEIQVTVALVFNFLQDFKIQQYKDHSEAPGPGSTYFGLLVVVVELHLLLVDKEAEPGGPYAGGGQGATANTEQTVQASVNTGGGGGGGANGASPPRMCGRIWSVLVAYKTH